MTYCMHSDTMNQWMLVPLQPGSSTGSAPTCTCIAWILVRDCGDLAQAGIGYSGLKC